MGSKRLLAMVHHLESHLRGAECFEMVCKMRFTMVNYPENILRGVK